MAYPDNWPIKKITAALTWDPCFISLLSYDTWNKGAEAILAEIDKWAERNEVVAYTTLFDASNPTLSKPVVDKDNKDIKIFDWKDIKTTDGKDFIPDWIEAYKGFLLYFIIETDEMTLTGVKNGFMGSGGYYLPDDWEDLKISVNNESVIMFEDIKIIQTPAGFRIDCDNRINVKDLTAYDTVGRVIKKSTLSGNVQSQEINMDLRDGIYFIRVTGTKNGNQTVEATLKVLKKH
jgi:hypothetical protein